MRRTRHSPPAVLVCLIVTWTLHSTCAVATHQYVHDQVLVRFNTGATQSCRDSALAHIGGSVIDTLSIVDAYVVALGDTSVIAAIAALESSYCVQSAQTNGMGPSDTSGVLLSANDTYYPYSNWLMNTGQDGGTVGADIRAEDGWDFVYESPGVLIAILDSGVDIFHTDLNIWTNAGETAGDNEDNDGNGYRDDVHGWDFYSFDNNPYDTYPHGTGTAGRAAAIGNNDSGMTGVTWNSPILPIKVLSNSGGFPSEGALILAVQYAVAQGAKVLNVSLRWDSDRFGQFLENAFNAAGDAGVLIVCGAGNRDEDNDSALPGPSTYASTGLMSIAATDNDNTFADPCPSPDIMYSSYGATTVDMAAPGCNLWTMYAAGGYSGGHSGTSASAPMVSGAAALLWTQNPTWTNVQIKTRLMATIDTLASCVGKMVAPGRLNLGRALDNVKPSTISDLTVESVGKNTMSLSWTDTGDDNTSGQARAYKLKRWTSPITTDAQFTDSYLAAAGTPGTSGTVHCIEVSGLSPCTTYYWALRLEDNAFNVSNLNATVSATTTCNNAMAICPEWFMAEGGEGGGGGSARTTPFEMSSYGPGMVINSLKSRVPLAVDRYGWRSANSLQISSEPGASDLLELSDLEPNANGDYRVKLLAMGSHGVELSSVALGAVDHEDGTAAIAVDSSVYSGKERVLASGVTLQGQDVSALYRDGGGVAQQVNDALSIELPAQGSSRVLVVEFSGLPTVAEQLAGGLDIQTRDQGGEWAHLTRLTPRRQTQTTGVYLGDKREVRLVATRPVHVHSLREVVGATLAEPTWLELATASGSGEERGRGEATLEQFEDLELLFSGAGAPEARRSIFLQVAAQTGSGLRASTSAIGGGDLTFALGSMRPNPAQGRITIDYVMAHEAPVTIRVYNVAGRLVRQLASGSQSAGARSVVWDGRDDSGSSAGKGVYFVRMDVPGWTNQRKMILLSDR